LAGALFTFYNMLVASPEQQELEKQKKLEAKRAKRAGKKV